jgi:hypothetical protein
MGHPEAIPQGVGVGAKYVPKVYGFRINKRSVYYRNMEGREEGSRSKKTSSKAGGGGHPSYEQQQAAYKMQMQGGRK